MARPARVRVGYDATALLGPRTGVGQMAAHLLEALAHHDDLDLTAFAVTWRGQRALREAIPSGVGLRTRRVPARLTRASWARTSAPRAELWTGPVDVVHAPNFVAPPSRAPVVVTVHDLTFVRYPEMTTADARTFPRLIQRAIDRGAVVHTVSDFVADEVREHFDIDRGRVVRIYSGIAPSQGGDAAHGRARAAAGRYVLVLGTIEPRKNLPNLVRAFDVVAATRRDLHLVVAGPDGWGLKEFDAAVADARHGARIRRLGYVDDGTRRDLLAGAAALAYPSIYEGFGHPPLEAMDAGVPVLGSSAGALPEVLGDAALLPDPLDVDALASALTTILDDDATRETLVARGHARVTRYTWAGAGDEFARLYRRRAEDAR
jgi:glycosyltransferase involved in cell wall biosynthesis